MKKSLYITMALVLLAGLILLVRPMAAQAQDPDPDANMLALGKAMFYDPRLSVNGTQSCATCHAPEVGFTGPDALVNSGGAVYQGALPNHFGNRKPPSSAYAGDSPELFYDETLAAWFGGMFWDGRATGATLHDPLAEQAQGPFLNPLEQAIAEPQVLCVRVKQSEYAGLFQQVWGANSLNCAKDTLGVYERIGRSVAAYERSAEVNPYSSKFDLFWDNAASAGKDVTQIHTTQVGYGSGATATATLAGGVVTKITVTNGGSGYIGGATVSFMGGGGGMGGGGATATAKVVDGVVTEITVTNGGSGYRMAPRVIITGADPYFWQTYRNFGLTDQELQGLAFFNDPDRANCSSCHSLEPGPKGYPLFTDFGYDNIGVPKNPENPFYTMPEAWNPDGANFVDYGLGGYLKRTGKLPEVYEPQMGKMKVPTLRNVDLRPTADFVKAYGHNGFFKSLEEIVFFYHWRGMMDRGGCMGGGMGDGGMGGGGMGGGGMGGNCEGMESMFPPPEVDQNRAALGMFPMMQMDNIVAFLKTLSDGYIQP